jgi:hypothetical protein
VKAKTKFADIFACEIRVDKRFVEIECHAVIGEIEIADGEKFVEFTELFFGYCRRIVGIKVLHCHGFDKVVNKH